MILKLGQMKSLKSFWEVNIIGVVKSSSSKRAGLVWRSEGVLGNVTKGRPRQWGEGADRIMDDFRTVGVEITEGMSRVGRSGGTLL